MRNHKLYRLKIQLDETPIWRRLELNGNINFGVLHEMIQIIMGWQNYHLYEFVIGKNSIMPEDEGYTNPPSKYNTDTPIKQALKKQGQIFKYIYDFGDYWKHTIEVEDIIEYKFEDMAKDFVNNELKGSPLCLDGFKKCPPEDVGSVDGYKEFIKSMKTKKGKYKENIEWYGSHFNEDEFNVEIVNKQLSDYFCLNNLKDIDLNNLSSPVLMKNITKE